MDAKQQAATAIVLARTDFGEADRILTFITPEVGKVRVLAKGVRRVRSKLAGGVELFSVSNVTFLKGRGELHRLVSARLELHYGDIVKDINRTMLGYELLKRINKNTEDAAESDYFQLLQTGLQALAQAEINLSLIDVWFTAQLLQLAGHMPNLRSDVSGAKLQIEATYSFSFEDTAFVVTEGGRFTADHIKLLRLLFSDVQPVVLQKVANLAVLLKTVQPVVQTVATSYLR